MLAQVVNTELLKLCCLLTLLSQSHLTLAFFLSCLAQLCSCQTTEWALKYIVLKGLLSMKGACV
eukprot:1956241-Amphidinium_carterae.1